MNISLKQLMLDCQRRTHKWFDFYLKQRPSPSSQLQQAMCYATDHSGKQIRPLLVYATGIALGASLDDCDAPACAIELIHSYSLIHDDLPAMDNSDLRRGKPSCHKAYNEALAILAGDAFQPLAFEILASHPTTLNEKKRLAMIQVLSEACGSHGMVAGQALDMENISSYESLEKVHRLKTGALLTASVKLGWLASPTHNTAIESILTVFANHLGLGFQIQDDLLDRESNSETLGKPSGIDRSNKKITFADLLGIEEAHKKVKTLFTEAENQIQKLGIQAKILSELTEYIFQRKK